MIEEVVTSAIEQVCPAFPYMAEQEAPTPFAVYKVVSVPTNTKEGVNGYTHEVEIAVVDELLLSAKQLSTQIIDAIKEYDDTTATQLNGAVLISRGGDYDEAQDLYYETIKMKLFSNDI